MTREEQYLRALWALVDAIDGFKRGGATGVAVETYDNALAAARSVLFSASALRSLESAIAKATGSADAHAGTDDCERCGGYGHESHTYDGHADPCPACAGTGRRA